MKKFFAAAPDARDAIIRQAEEERDKITDAGKKERAAIYVKIMQKIVETSKDFVNSELTRVKKLSEGKVSDKKKLQLNDRSSILTSFQLLMKDEL